MTKRLITIALMSCIELCGLAAQDSIVQDTTVSKRQKPPRNYFTHRAIALNTAAPLPKGTVNFYNYYLLYNEVEYAFHDRFAASVGYMYFVGEQTELPISVRLRYQIPINQKLYWALGYQGYTIISRTDIRPVRESQLTNLWTSCITYCSPKLTFSISGGSLQRIYIGSKEEEQGFMVGFSALWIPKRTGVFSILTELNYGPGLRTVFSPGYLPIAKYHGIGFQLSSRRITLLVFGAQVQEDLSETYYVPGASLKFLLRKPSTL
jgi:hypothetical protein